MDEQGLRRRIGRRRRQPAPRRRPRLVHLTTVDGSLEILLGSQLRSFLAAGYEVIGVSAPGESVAVLERDGIRHIALEHATRAFSLTSDLRTMVELYRLFRRLRPDIVHTHNPKPGIYGRIAARAARVPVVVNTQHGIYAQPRDPWRKRAVVYSLERVAAACSDVELIQNSEDHATLARLRVPARKLVLLGNGVDLTRFDPGRFDGADRAWARAELGARHDGERVVGCVARLVPEKGIAELVEAAAQVMAADPSVRFSVVGPEDPNFAAAMRPVLARAREVGVALVGRRSEIERLYTGMDLFVLPSHREGFPRSVMEAAAMGVPVIATDIRGCREAVVDGSTGWLVPLQDPARLAAAIRCALDEADLASMGRNAVELAHERFDVHRQVALSLGAYDRLLRATGSPTASR